ncbi:hypothetical protein AB0D04_08635 [Streptomyces sp. NPDC048483]|uniref:hypothetical protein n=1 Tax=Streptomyces sp. NPDC048483 TaxID=3154927 RepID=UPI00341EE9FC
MDELGYTQEELAKAVNGKLIEAGERDGVGDRTVRTWLTGKTAWPHRAKREALQAVFGCTAEELGFTPPPEPPAPPPEEPHVHRRRFVTAVGGTAAAAVPLIAACPTVGTSDVQRLRAGLACLWLMDDQEGGGSELERRALELCKYTENLQQAGSATSRIRSRLYALAASFTAAAMWAAVDTRSLDRAQRHLEKATHLAVLSGDGQVQHQAWRSAAMLAEQRGRPSDAVAAMEAAMATSTHRRDPLYASLTHANLAMALAVKGERHRARRALDRAADAFERADPQRPRSASVAFFTQGELDGLTAATLLRLGNAEQAEAHTYRCLGALRPDQHRNRAFYTAQVALCQVDQGDLEMACATAATVAPPPDSPGGRIGHMLSSFTKTISEKAPDAAATRAWRDRMRRA